MTRCQRAECPTRATHDVILITDHAIDEQGRFRYHEKSGDPVLTKRYNVVTGAYNCQRHADLLAESCNRQVSHA